MSTSPSRTRPAGDDAAARLCDRTTFLRLVDGALGRLDQSPLTLAVLSARVRSDHLPVGPELGVCPAEAVNIAVRRVCAAVRASDHVGCGEDDDLTILCTDLTSCDEAIGIARRLLAILDEPVVGGDRPVWLRSKVGVAFPRALERDAQVLLDRSRSAMLAPRIEPSARYDVTLGW